MPIKAIERTPQLREVLRIRMGEKVPSAKNPGKTFPRATDTFRLTAPNREILDEAAGLWGGEVQRWADPALPAPQWQLLTETDTLPCLVPTGLRSLNQWYEMWSGGGCQRRCDGELESLSFTDCMCPADPEEREALAAEGKACKATTRLSVLLPQLHEFGSARLESHGYYAAVELHGAFELCRAARAAGVEFLPADLRIERRTIRRPNKPIRNFVVPVLAIRTSLAEALGLDKPAAGIEPPRRELPEGIDPDFADDIPPQRQLPAPPIDVPEERDTWLQQAVTRAHAAGLDGEETLELVKLLTKGRTTHFEDLTDVEWLVYWQVVERLRRDELGMLLEPVPGEDRSRWRFCDNRQRPVRLNWDEQAAITVELTTSDQYRSPADWKEAMKGSGATQGTLIRQAQAIAAEIGVDPPAALADLTDADLCSRLAQWVDQQKQARQKQQVAS